DLVLTGDEVHGDVAFLIRFGAYLAWDAGLVVLDKDFMRQSLEPHGSARHRVAIRRDDDAGNMAGVNHAQSSILQSASKTLCCRLLCREASGPPLLDVDGLERRMIRGHLD